MEFLIAAGVTIVAQLFKFFVTKFGDEKLAKNLILVGVFCLSVTGTYVQAYLKGTFSFSAFDFDAFSQIFFVSVGYYETVVKRLIMPALEVKLD